MTMIILFSDIDGTLLDERTYSPEASIASLRRLQTLGITIVLCSSKTQQEQEKIRGSLGIEGPFIVENGSAIVIPANTINVTDGAEEGNGVKVLILGVSRDVILHKLAQIRINYRLTFEGFNDLSTAQVAQVTGLTFDDAQQARSRKYSETIVTDFTEEQLKRFTLACKRNGLEGIHGGRFINIVGKGVNKGRAVSLLTQYFQSQFGKVTTFGIGDSTNDEAMLRAVKHPFLVQRPNGNWESLHIDGLRYVRAIGPRGFAAVIEHIQKQCFTKP